MVQETMGSGATERKDSAELPTGPATTQMTDAERDELASQLVDRLSLWSGAAGLIPVPLVDMIAVGGVQLHMLRRLSEIYGVPFSENRGKSVLASVAGAVIPAARCSCSISLQAERFSISIHRTIVSSSRRKRRGWVCDLERRRRRRLNPLPRLHAAPRAQAAALPAIDGPWASAC